MYLSTGHGGRIASKKGSKPLARLSVSVALATFNGSRFLAEQLADLAAQTALPTELVVCDDASTDDTVEIVERFAASAPFQVRIHRNAERLGYRGNFLKCASLCQSDLIAFCDQDDRWAPTKLATMIACFKDREVLLAFHGAEIVSEDEQPLGRFANMPRRVGATAPLGGSPWTFALGFTQVFRRWLCECDSWWPLSVDHDNANQRMAHDQWYFFLAATFGKIINVDASLARYRQHGANVFGWTGAKASLPSRLLGRVRSMTWLSEGRFQAARQRARILEHAAKVLSSPYDERAADGAQLYRQLAELAGYRARIYAGDTVSTRLRSFFALVRAHGYGADPWKFGLRAFVTDLTIGLAGAGRANVSPSTGVQGGAAGAL